jgi:nucleoid-associated protein YgaU
LTPPRVVIVAIVVLGAGLGAALLWRERPQTTAPETAAPAAVPPIAATPATPPSVAPSPAAPSPAVTEAEATPRFDIVRVTPEGTAVIAGRAAPDADVTILADGKAIGHVTADAAGEFVFTPDAAFAPGPHAISLAAKAGSGAEMHSSSDVLVVVAGTQPGERAPAGALATLAPAGAASPDMPKLLQAPSAMAAKTPATDMSPPSSPRIEVLDYDQAGHLRLSGRAAPGNAVSLAIDGQAAGDAAADQDGHWTMAPPRALSPGHHHLTLVARGADNTVTGTLSLPFLREKLAPGSLKPGMMVVQPGQNLWRIAREVYGSGIRYTIIFAANRAHIQRPGIIYPGQTLVVPPAPGIVPPAPGRSPASSNTSR